MNTHHGRLIRLAGTPYDIGYAMGQHMGPRLEANIARYIQGRAPDLSKDRDWRQGALPWLRNLPPRYQDEFAGLVDGAGLPLQRVAEWPYAEVKASGGCTSTLVTILGQVWVARNNDYIAPDLWGYAAIKEVAGRIPTLIFGMEGDVFGGTGINRERLWLHYHYLPASVTPPSDAALPCHIWLIEALETCRTLPDVESLLAAMPRDGAMLLFAVDGKRDERALYECQGDTYRRREDSGAWLAGTNHSESMPDADDAPLSSVRRQARMDALVQALVAGRSHRHSTPAVDLIPILADDGIERRSGDAITVYANVACPATGMLWYTFGGFPAASQGRWEWLAWPWPD
ncbi:MAG: C45 family autoproteolytic acyltransferase/hydrolase [Anaerolineae bacterium]